MPTLQAKTDSCPGQGGLEYSWRFHHITPNNTVLNTWIFFLLEVPTWCLCGYHGLWEPQKGQRGRRGTVFSAQQGFLWRVTNCPGSVSHVQCSLQGSRTQQPFLIYPLKSEGASNYLLLSSYPATSWLNLFLACQNPRRKCHSSTFEGRFRPQHRSFSNSRLFLECLQKCSECLLVFQSPGELSLFRP